MKRERGKIMRQKYSQRSSLVELLKGELYDHRKLSRKQEYEADSLGYQILIEAGYDGTDYIKMLELSLRYDTIKPKELNPEVYSNYFDLPGQAFKPQWLKQENFSEYKYVAKGAANLSDDSVATHPELTDRINHLKSLYPELNNKQQETSVSSKEYKEIQMLAKYEFLPNLYDLEYYGLGVYITLKMLTQETNNDYCFYWLGQFFQKIAQARKDYKLSKYLDIVIPEKQSESYIQFLSFMWNLSYEELLYIADFYTEKNKG